MEKLWPGSRGWRGAAIGQLNSGALIEFGQSALSRQADQFQKFGGGKILGTLQQPGSTIVGDEDGYGIHGIGAGDGAAKPSRQHASAFAGAIGEIGKGVAGYAAGGECQRRFFILGERNRRVRAGVLERTSGDTHPQTQSPRTAVEQDFEQSRFERV